MHPWQRPCSTANHPKHTLSPSRTYVRIPSWNSRMTKIVLCGTPQRATTVQRRVRSTESYALVRSIKHTYNITCFFRAYSCSRRITNIISVVERFGRKPFCLFLRQDPHAFAVLAEAANDDLQQYLAGVLCQRDASVVAALYRILLFMEYHDDGIFSLTAVPPSKNKRRYRAVYGAGRDHR